MLHDIDNRIDLDPSKMREPRKGDCIILFYKRKILLPKEGSSSLLIDFDKLVYPNLRYIYLGELEGRGCFITVSDTTHLVESYNTFDLFATREFFSRPERWISSIASSFYEWYSNNRFCGRCGSPMTLKEGHRSLHCSSCGHMVFPKISPAIIVLIKKGREILLARNSNFKSSFFSLVAGYVDAGETLEECVAREVNEEVGLEVTNIRYYKSQPWPYSSSLMVAFVADLTGPDIITVDGDEIAEAHWFTSDNLPLHPGKDSIAGEMIEDFIQGKI